MAYKKSTKLLPYQYQPTRNVFRSAGASTNSCRTLVLVVYDSGSVDDLHEWEWSASTNSCRTLVLVVSDSGSVDDLHEWEWG